MFARYTNSAKRAIFFANYLTLCSDAPKIDSVSLLSGLMFDEGSRAQAVFSSSRALPDLPGFSNKYAQMPKRDNAPPLDNDAKQSLIRTAIEANRFGDYWIDTEHVVLGILHVSSSQAAMYLLRSGLTLRAARQKIKENKQTRPIYGPMPRTCRFQAPALKLMAIVEK